MEKCRCSKTSPFPFFPVLLVPKLTIVSIEARLFVLSCLLCSSVSVADKHVTGCITGNFQIKCPYKVMLVEVFLVMSVIKFYNTKNKP